jgi:hypothetical protein
METETSRVLNAFASGIVVVGGCALIFCLCKIIATGAMKAVDMVTKDRK